MQLLMNNYLLVTNKNETSTTFKNDNKFKNYEYN